MHLRLRYNLFLPICNLYTNKLGGKTPKKEFSEILVILKKNQYIQTHRHIYFGTDLYVLVHAVTDTPGWLEV